MKKKLPVKRYKTKFILEELESRQLFSGGAEAVLPPPPDNAASAEIHVDANLEPVTDNQTQTPGNQFPVNPTIPNAPASNDTSKAQAASPSEAIKRQEIAFIDTNVKNYQQLVEDFKQQNDANRQIEVVLLTADRDGLQQISETLQGRQGIDAIHIFSHGIDGAVELGGTWFNSYSLESHANAVKQWGEALTPDADILLYGCNVAENADGKLFIDRLANLTGAEVTASDDNTGASALGGDWNLEYATGSIETTSAISLQTQTDWTNVMAITTGNTSSSMTTGATSLTFCPHYRQWLQRLSHR